MHIRYIPENDEQQFPFHIRSVSCRQRGTDYRTPLHSHNFHQLYLSIEHQVGVSMDDEWIALEPGEFVIIPPGAIRGFRSMGEEPQYAIIHFTPEDDRFETICGTKQSVPPADQPLIDRLVGELMDPTHETEQMIYALTTQLFIDVCRHISVPLQKRIPEDERVRMLERFMKSNYHRGLSRDDFAKAVFLSPSHVGHLYRSVTGQTLIARLTEIRVDEAKKLLVNTSLPITYIAHEVGFNSFSHFTQLFKRHTGRSPSTYRA